MHGIHKKCYDEHMKTAYRCPICNKSAVNMETQFRNLDRSIAEQPMPPEFRDTKAMVSCNDCYAKSAVMYHWLGLKCAICDSYNTTQLSILSDPAVEVPLTNSQENENLTPPDQSNGQTPPSQYLAPGPVRSRRHSSHTHTPPLPELHRFSPYVRPQRIVRSVSPVRIPLFLDEPVAPQNMETDDVTDEDELDFWGRDESRNSTLVENVDEEMEDDEESDQDSTIDDFDEEGDEDDHEFDLFGHR